MGKRKVKRKAKAVILSYDVKQSREPAWVVPVVRVLLLIIGVCTFILIARALTQ